MLEFITEENFSIQAFRGFLFFADPNPAQEGPATKRLA
jgi:hypothetical protein